MVGTLTRDQIEHLLRENFVGRLACIADNKPYVVPIAYAFDGTYIVAHSREGLKVKLMRKNKNVCFEVDKIFAMNSWQSIIIQGKYEELKSGSEYDHAVKLLNDRFISSNLSESSRPSYHSPDGRGTVEKQKRSVVFRIAIKEVSGRFEK